MGWNRMKTYSFAYGSGTVELPLDEKNVIGELARQRRRPACRYPRGAVGLARRTDRQRAAVRARQGGRYRRAGREPT